LLDLNYVKEKWPEATKTVEQLLLLGDSTTATISKLGTAYYQTQNYLCGIAVLTALRELEQTETTAYYTAVCYKQLKDQKNAIFYLKKALLLSISPNAATYYNEMADSYETNKQFKQAQDAYQKGLLYNEKPITYYFLATLFDTELKDKKNAVKYYKKYIAAKPDEKQKTYINYSLARITELSHK
jgi:tetratricopeptide (TPR) repeat protein